MTAKDAITAANVYQILYPNISSTPTISKDTVVNIPKFTKISEEKTKKQELTESLDYLNKKTSKSKKDRETISMIEAVLKNM